MGVRSREGRVVAIVVELLGDRGRGDANTCCCFSGERGHGHGNGDGDWYVSCLTRSTV